MPTTVSSNTHLWAGTEASFDRYLAMERAAMTRFASVSGKVAMEDDDDDDDDDYKSAFAPGRISEDIGATRVINVAGPILTNDEWWHKYAGITSYELITRELVKATHHPDVKRVVLKVASGGGAVTGISDMTATLNKVASLKPLITYASGDMCSAAYWIGACGAVVFASSTSDVGSIGVIMVHTEYTKMLEEIGVKRTSFRSGEFKALGQAHEKLSDKAREVFQGMVDDTDKLFVAHVASVRGRSEAYVRETMGEGRVFIAGRAKEIGLIDGISTFQEVMQRSEGGEFDKLVLSHQNSRKGGHMPQAIILPADQQAAAALAAAQAGVDPKGAEADQPAGDPENPGKPETQAEVKPDAKPEAKNEGDGGTASAITQLTQQLAERDATIVDLRVKLGKTESDLQALTDGTVAAQAQTIAAMSAIVAASASNMHIALHQSARDFSGMAPDALMAEHQRLSESFRANYKVGGVAAVQADAAKPGTEKPKRSAHDSRVLQGTSL